MSNSRDLDGIAGAGQAARDAAWASSLEGLAGAVRQSYAAQLAEGMAPLAGSVGGVTALAVKYCGGGFGGYALYLCANQADRDRLCGQPEFRSIEPYVLSGR